MDTSNADAHYDEIITNTIQENWVKLSKQFSVQKIENIVGVEVHGGGTTCCTLGNASIDTNNVRTLSHASNHINYNIQTHTNVGDKIGSSDVFYYNNKYSNDVGENNYVAENELLVYDNIDAKIVPMDTYQCMHAEYM